MKRDIQEFSKFILLNELKSSIKKEIERIKDVEKETACLNEDEFAILIEQLWKVIFIINKFK